MNEGLRPHSRTGTEPMGICIPAQQQYLEEEEAIAPNRRAAAEPRQDVAAHNRLNLEQQKGADEDGERETQVDFPLWIAYLHKRT